MQANISKCIFIFPVKLVVFSLEDVQFLWISGTKRTETNVESSGCVPLVLISTKSGNMWVEFVVGREHGWVTL
jgi:hypothetical protein